MVPHFEHLIYSWGCLGDVAEPLGDSALMEQVHPWELFLRVSPSPSSLSASYARLKVFSQLPDWLLATTHLWP